MNLRLQKINGSLFFSDVQTGSHCVRPQNHYQNVTTAFGQSLPHITTTQPLIEMSTRCISWGVKAASALG